MDSKTSEDKEQPARDGFVERGDTIELKVVRRQSPTAMELRLTFFLGLEISRSGEEDGIGQEAIAEREEDEAEEGYEGEDDVKSDASEAEGERKKSKS